MMSMYPMTGSSCFASSYTGAALLYPELRRVRPLSASTEPRSWFCQTQWSDAICCNRRHLGAELRIRFGDPRAIPRPCRRPDRRNRFARHRCSCSRSKTKSR